MLRLRSVYKNLKQARRYFSLAFFLIICLSIWFVLPGKWSENIISLQLGPAFIHLTMGWAEWSVGGLLIIALIVAGLGKIYCSTVCPLGFLQDVMIWLGRTIRIKYTWQIRRKKMVKVIRIGLLLMIIIFFILGSAFGTGLLEPFSIFSRFLFTLKMLLNGLVKGNVIAILFISGIIILIAIFSLKTGRFFCSRICPVGTILWGLSGISFFRFKIENSSCNHCSQCIAVCKAGAISEDIKIIDQAFCVGCFNCSSVCRQNAIKHIPDIKKRIKNRVSRAKAEM